MTECKGCGNNIPSNSESCPYCGRKTAIRKIKHNDKIKCVKCSSLQDASNVRCKVCGAPLLKQRLHKG